VERVRGALAEGLVHDDGAGDGDVERGDLASHGDAQEVVAGFLDEVVEACALAAQDEDAVGAEVEGGVVGAAALIEAKHPDVGLLHLLEGADEVGDAGDADVLGRAGGGLGDGRRDWCGPAFGEDDAVDAGAVGGAEEGAEVVRVFDAVEGEEEAVVLGEGGRGGEEVFDGEEGALADEGERALVGVGAGEAGELVAGFEGDADAGGAAGEGELVQAGIAGLRPSRARMTESRRRAPERTASSTGCRP
jgi:hypothetical protein